MYNNTQKNERSLNFLVGFGVGVVHVEFFEVVFQLFDFCYLVEEFSGAEEKHDVDDGDDGDVGDGAKDNHEGDGFDF